MSTPVDPTKTYTPPAVSLNEIRATAVAAQQSAQNATNAVAGKANTGANADITDLTALPAVRGAQKTLTAWLGDVAAMQAPAVASLLRRGRALTGVAALDPLDASPVLATKDYRLQPGFTPEANTFTRGSTALYPDAMPLFRSAAVNELRFAADPATGENLGALLEESRTNAIRNNAMQGAAAGTPGTAPTNWTITGLTQVVGVGTENGIDYIDLRFSGAAGGSFRVSPETVSVTAAADQTYTCSAFVRLIAGDLAPFGRNFVHRIVDLAPTVITNVQVLTPTGGALATQRPAMSRTLDAATTSFRYDIIGTAASAYDITLRVGLPQCERGATVTSPIRTTNAAVTRATDVFALPLDATWYNSAEGTLYFEAVVPLASSLNHVPFQVDNGSNDARITPVRSPSGILSLRMVVGGTLVANPAIGAVTPGAPLRLALAYSGVGVAASLNGGAAVREIFSASLPTMTTLRLGASRSSTEFWNSFISRFTHVPRALSPDTLQRMAA